MTRSRSSARNTPGTRLTDTQIAAEAKTRLAWDAALPKDAVKIKVSHGRITLLGVLQQDQQRTAALEDVTRLFGVTGVCDHTTIKPK
jgi:osmotically-inducible protein OsmY